MKRRITLNMIVKNESKIIERCLDSVKDIIDDYAILDTGSSDNTIELITNFFKEYNIPGKVKTSEFIDFSYNRNEALSLCKDSNYILLLDADMILSIDKNFNKDDLMVHGYYIVQNNGNLRYKNIRLINNKDNKWLYKGVTHEHIEHEYGIISDIEGLTIEDVNDGGSKEDKFKRDVILLENALKEEPNNKRYQFYLAQSYKDIGNLIRALYYYQKRIDNGWIEERYVACTKAIQCKAELDHSIYEIIGLTLYSQKLIPERIEAIYEAMKYIRCKGNEEEYEIIYNIALQSIQPIPESGLFLDISIYNWKYFDELSILAYYTGDKENYKMLMDRIIEDKLYDKESEERINRNMEFCFDSVKPLGE